jgi:hypothetical protein
MKITSLLSLAALLPMTALNAEDTLPATGCLAPDLNAALGSSITVTADASEREALAEPGQTQMLLARADDADDEQKGKAKGKGKGNAKGKAKGHDKDNGQDADADQKEKAGSAPATAEPTQAKPAPPPPAAATPAPADSSAGTPAASSRRAPAELKAEMDQRLARITALDKNTATSKARFSTISKETGVPVATLEGQRKAHNVGSGGILIANEIAKATGKPAGTFMKQRLEGRNWEQIAAENKFDLAPVLPKLQRLQNAMEAVPQPAKR